MILRRYADVAAALREPRLIAVTARAPAGATAIDRAAHEEFRSQALQALGPAAIQRVESLASAALPTGNVADLVGDYAVPWSLAVAGIAAGVPDGERARLSSLARRVFDAACEPFDESRAAAGQQATVELARYFRAAPPWHLQMFVALAHSLPAFLGNAWLALLEHPAALAELRGNPALLPAAIDELARFAGPAKAQFRRAAEAVTIGGCTIPAGEQVILRLDLANRDPEVFPDPDELRFTGRSRGHLAFGAGVHACVGAGLIQSLAAVATRALLERFPLDGPFEAARTDSTAMQYVAALFYNRA